MAYKKPLTEQEQISALLRKIKRMPGNVGADVIAFLKAMKVKFTVTDQVDQGRCKSDLLFHDGVLYPVAGTQEILLNTQELNNPNHLIMVVLHESHHLRQIFNELIEPNKFTSPVDLLVYQYFREADAQSDAIIRMFKAHLQGDGSAFEAAYSDIEYKQMLDTAKKGYEQNPASLNNGRLRRMVFDAWFLGDQKAHYIQKLVKNDWERFCRSCFSKKAPKARLTIKDLEKIGTIGDEGINYLTLPGFRPLNDLYYRGSINNSEKKSLENLTRAWKKMPSPVALGNVR